MDCRQVNAILDDHAAGALSAAEKAEVAAHLEQCPRCADAWLAAELLAGDAPEPSRAGFYEATLAVVAGAPADTAVPRPVRRVGPAAGLAAAALTGLVLIGLVRSGDEGTAPDPAADDAIAAQEAADGGAGGPILADTPVPEPAVPGLIAGVHYARLPVPVPTSSAPDRIEVCEFFMFLCPHCYELESELTAFVAARNDAVELVRVPALFNDLSRLHARAFYTAEVLGRRDALIEPFYDEIHERGNALASVAAIRELFARHGIDGQRFDEAFDSAEVRARLDRAEELNRLYRVNATPSIGVNGRYLTSPSMTGSAAEMLEVVDRLVEAEAEAEAEAPACDGDGDNSLRCLIQHLRVPPEPGAPPVFD